MEFFYPSKFHHQCYKTLYTIFYFLNANKILIVHMPLKLKVTITRIMYRDIHMKW